MDSQSLLSPIISNVDIAAGAVAAIAPTLLAKIDEAFGLIVGAPPNAPWRPSTRELSAASP